MSDTTIMESPFAHSYSGYQYVGIMLVGGIEKKFWTIKCPCGVESVFALNSLPEVDTPHPCGCPDHWTIKYQAVAK